MATMAKDRFDSNIYENTDFMPKSATNAPETNEVSTIYEPLRMKDGKLNQVNAATTMKGKCVKRRWWIAGAVVTVLLCTGLSLLTGMYVLYDLRNICIIYNLMLQDSK